MSQPRPPRNRSHGQIRRHITAPITPGRVTTRQWQRRRQRRRRRQQQFRQQQRRRGQPAIRHRQRRAVHHRPASLRAHRRGRGRRAAAGRAGRRRAPQMGPAAQALRDAIAADRGAGGDAQRPDAGSALEVRPGAGCHRPTEGRAADAAPCAGSPVGDCESLASLLSLSGRQPRWHGREEEHEKEPADHRARPSRYPA